ncbi:hypothetical protein ScPMuIL_016398 [Solemya velum]
MICKVFLISVIVVFFTHQSQSQMLDSLVRRNVPKGHTLEKFVGVCETCGAIYGSDLSYRCMIDKTFKTFKTCLVATETR